MFYKKTDKMEVEDLRIGNFINFEGDFYTVEQICFDGWLQLDNGQLNTYISECTPIEITEEWLMKLGFKKHKNIIGSYIKTPKNTAKGYGFRLHTQHPFDELFSEIYEIYMLESQIHVYGGLKYIHHLQNLYYALTSEELKYKEIK